MFRVTAPVIKRVSICVQVINLAAKIADFGHKWGNSLWKWSAYPHPAWKYSPGIMSHSNCQFYSMQFCQPLHMHKLKDDITGDDKNNCSIMSF